MPSRLAHNLKFDYLDKSGCVLSSDGVREDLILERGFRGSRILSAFGRTGILRGKAYEDYRRSRQKDGDAF